MNDRCNPGPFDRRKHGWEHLEPVFQTLLDLRRSGTGDHSAAIQQYYDEIHPVVLATARRLLARGQHANWLDSADDAAQRWHVAMLLDGGLDRCDGRPVHPYAYGVLNNICLDLRRKSRRSTPLPQDYDPADTRFNPFRAVVKNEVNRRVRQKINSLPPDLRRAIDGQFVEELTAEEAAAKEGITAKGMHSRRFRGRRLLLDDLSEHREWDW